MVGGDLTGWWYISITADCSEKASLVRRNVLNCPLDGRIYSIGLVSIRSTKGIIVEPGPAHVW